MKRVIIWGYKPHTHTHSYIHWSFFDGFKSLGYASKGEIPTQLCIMITKKESH